MSKIWNDIKSTTLIDSALPERNLNIKIDNSFFRNQEERIIQELGLNSNEAKIISKAILDLVDEKIKEKERKISSQVKGAISNLVIGILVEELKLMNDKGIGQDITIFNFSEVVTT
jgi:hypothetical protein